VLSNVSTIKEPVFVHTVTKKGKGYKYAEEDPIKFHGVTSFNVQSGNISELEEKEKTFTCHFGEKIVKLAKKDAKIVAITAAMPDGTGLSKFAEKFPEKFFDVGITEAHAVTFAAGLAKGGMKPVVAIYSTFLQRSYDQLIHDVALQGLPIVFCIDRAGLVGKDGPTHHGVFDIAYMRTLPGFVVMAPKDGVELELMMEKALEWNKPVAIRYPRAAARQIVSASSYAPLKIGASEVLRKGGDLVILAVGSMVNNALFASEVLSKKGIEAQVINARFIKPLDREMLERIAHSGKKIFTIEEGVVAGGYGSAVLEFFEREQLRGVQIRCLGLPDHFIEHGARHELLRKYHLAPDEIAAIIEAEL
jgi:1-deoxy-D-xylulose-5-phosphate synthase